MRPQAGAHPGFFPCCKHFFWGGFRDDPAADVALIFFLDDAARTVSMTLEHFLTCCNTAAKSTYCNSHCNTLQLALQRTATLIASHCTMISDIATHCNLNVTDHRHIATHCNLHCNALQLALQRTATLIASHCTMISDIRGAHCNTLQHTATHCNTLQQ